MAQLISSQLVATQRRVYLTFMDCFGATQKVSLSLLGGPTVAEKSATVLAGLTSAEDAVKAYASANNQDLTEQLASGAAAIAVAVAAAIADGIAPPSASS